jgi:glutamate-1-semialdehyde 2,1-aminomutase
LQQGLECLAQEAGLAGRIGIVGRPQWSLIKFRNPDGSDSAVLKNLFQQEAVKRGILLLATHNMTAAHDTAAIEQTLQVYAEVVKTLAGWLSDPHPERFLEGTMAQPVFKVR